MLKRLLWVLMFLLLWSPIVHGQAYIKQCIIDDNCDLDTVNVSSSAQLTTALSTAAAGDKIVLAAGNYFTASNPDFTLSISGTSNNPILIVASGWPSAPVRATIGQAGNPGRLLITGSHVYVVGLEFYGGGGAATHTGDAIELRCGNCGAINNFIWDDATEITEDSGTGIGAWNNGPQIIYGNIIHRRRYGTYTQNDYATHGYKYFVGNAFLESHNGPPATVSEPFLVHAYTETGLISGFHFERNIFRNHRWRMGGLNEPHHHSVLDENYSYNTTYEFGYRRPMWLTFTDNYIGKGAINDQWHWGDGETQFTTTWNQGAMTITGNKIVNTSGSHFQMRTSAYLASGRAEGIPNLRSADVVNNNTYLSNDGLFHGSFYAGGNNQVDVDGLTDWRSYSLAKGEQFDLNSTQGLFSSETNKSFEIDNEYDSTRHFLVVYNWTGATSVSYAGSAEWTAYDADNPYGAPITTGTNTDSIPLTGEFEVFLIIDEAPPAPLPCNIAGLMGFNGIAATLIAQQYAVGVNEKLSFQKRVRQMRLLNLQMAINNLDMGKGLEVSNEVCQ